MDFNIEKNSDKEYVLGQVRQQGKFLDLASEDFKKDKEVVLEAVKNDPEALEFASVELKGDKEIVLESVKKVGWTICYACQCSGYRETDGCSLEDAPGGSYMGSGAE